MTRTPLTTALAVALATVLIGCSAPDTGNRPDAGRAEQSAKAQSAQAELDAIYEQYWEGMLDLNPIMATYIGDDSRNDQLPNYLSPQYRQQVHDFNRKWLDRVRTIDPSTLDAQARLSYDIFVRDLQTAIEGERFPAWMQPVDQFGAYAPNQFPSLVSYAIQLGSGEGAQPFNTVKDYDNWLKRGDALVALLQQAIANMREGMAAGVTQPKVLMERVLPQLDAIIKDTPEQTYLWGPISRMPADFSAADKKRLTDAYRAMIGERLIPAYANLRAFIADEYLPACRDTVSLSTLPDGEAWYAYKVRTLTTTDMTPAQIHQLGLDEVKRIHGEMEKVMREVGFKGDLKAFFQFVTRDEQFEFKNEKAMFDAYNGVSARIDAGVPKLFSLVPKAPFEIRPVEASRAASAAGGQYYPPSADGSRPGIFYLNSYDLPSRKTWEMESLFLHEAIPGHHFQIALQQERTSLPEFRRFGGETAFAEGWALYAESLGKDLGVYTDPYQRFGQLQGELWRAVRLVVDTGLHSKGWTREQVIDYMLANSAKPKTDAVVEAERYIAIPGQALAYKIGEIKLQQLRNRAQAKLGDAFDIREFHARLLEDGALPLSVLETKIDRWISDVQAQRTP